MLIMEDIHNPYLQLFRKIETLEKKVDLLLQRTGKVDLFDEFNVEGLKPAAKILGYKSTRTLNKKIEKEDVLKENIHYRISTGNRYFFSQGALLSVKGMI